MLEEEVAPEEAEARYPEGEIVERLIVRSYPKVTVLAYIIGLVALGLSIAERFVTDPTVVRALGMFFVGLFVFLLAVAAFEFTETKIFLSIAIVVIAILAYIVIGGKAPEKTALAGLLRTFDTSIGPDAYLFIAIGSLLVFFLILLSRRFDYWIFESNRITHKTGLFGKSENFSTQGIRYSIEITDVFEYLLFYRSGTVKVYLPTEGKMITLSMVPNIRKVEREFEKIFGKIEVG